jgi:hypothetical protein
MAQALAYHRSTQQPVTIDTVAGTASSLGTAFSGMQTTSIFPARCVNLFTTFNGNTYDLVLTAVGAVQIQVYNGTSWSTAAGPYAPTLGHTFTPLCMHVINNVIVALWTDNALSGDGIRGVTSPDGVTWTAIPNGTIPINGSVGGHSVVYRAAIWFATSTGLWAIAPLHRTLTLTSVTGGPFIVGETIIGSVSGTTATVRSFSALTIKVDTLTGGTGDFDISETVTGETSGAHGAVATNTMYVNGSPDIGNDGGLSGTAGPANQLGSFASWDGVLYFIQAQTTANQITLYQLSTTWTATAIVPIPQWTNTAFNGLPTASFSTVTNDAGMYCLFVNNNDQLCLFFSGATATKLATATSKALPLQFTDITNNVLPAALASKTNLGIVLYDDDRRLGNNLQSLLIRDLGAQSVYICPWNGSAPIAIEATISGVDFMLPFTHHGEEPTFTNITPSISITAVSQPFPGQVRIDYTVRCTGSFPVSILGEYTTDGDNFFSMTEGDGDSGSSNLATSPSGINYFWLWSAFVDLQGNYNNLGVRLFARISEV